MKIKLQQELLRLQSALRFLLQQLQLEPVRQQLSFQPVLLLFVTYTFFYILSNIKIISIPNGESKLSIVIIADCDLSSNVRLPSTR